MRERAQTEYLMQARAGAPMALSRELTASAPALSRFASRSRRPIFSLPALRTWGCRESFYTRSQGPFHHETMFVTDCNYSGTYFNRRGPTKASEDTGASS